MSHIFPSKQYPGIVYEPGDDLWCDDLLPAGELPFYFDVSEELTGDLKAMQIAARFLDDRDRIAQKAKEAIRTALQDQGHPQHELVRYFFQAHREEMDGASFAAMLHTDAAGASQLSDLELLDRLYLKRLGSCVDGALAQQMFVLDFSFDPEYTDELLVLYLTTDAQVLLITHES